MKKTKYLSPVTKMIILRGYSVICASNTGNSGIAQGFDWDGDYDEME